MIAQMDNPADEWVIEHVDPAKLRRHELNTEIYGDSPNEGLTASIEKHGIRNMPRVNADYTIIAGATRIQSARILGKKSVAILRHKTQLSDLEVRRQLILDNHEPNQRERSKAVRAREYEALKAVEEEIARSRRAAAGGAKSASSKNDAALRDSNSGKAKRRAAAGAGMSEPTAEMAAAVVRKADELRAAGDATSADGLIDKLNSGPVASAYRAATQLPEQKAQSEAQTIEECKGLPPAVAAAKAEFRSLAALHNQYVDKVRKLAATPGGALLRVQEIESDLGNARRGVAFSEPEARCPYCRGDGKYNGKQCTGCFGRGWVNASTYENAPSEMKGKK